MKTNSAIFFLLLAAIMPVFEGCVRCVHYSTKETVTVSEVFKTGLPDRDIYEWRIYTLADENAELDNFYKDVLIPAYNRQGVSVGAFTTFKPDEKAEKQRYYLFVYPDINTFYKVQNAIWKDETFNRESKRFFEYSAQKPVYSNYESFLCEAFERVPHLLKPAADRTLFEFRLYQSPNAEANQRKIKMFNVEEINLFDKTGVNSVCYGKVLAGSQMPSLIYLIWHRSEETRTAAWNTFVNHEDWKRMKALPEYANTVTNIKVALLAPLSYSQY
ncbi:MAG: NIPSNAP family protein [Prevotellaceae bacterium]|nr:NIPSNAP family protein [Prevotellaceae bacterium]